ncbi:hypothetical protein MJ547_04225 [Burkholderia gladioli]
MCYSKSKDFNHHVKGLVHDGWTFIPKGRHKHAKLLAPNGRAITVPGSPSDWRGLRNFKRDSAHIASLPKTGTPGTARPRRG